MPVIKKLLLLGLIIQSRLLVVSTITRYKSFKKGTKGESPSKFWYDYISNKMVSLCLGI